MSASEESLGDILRNSVPVAEKPTDVKPVETTEAASSAAEKPETAEAKASRARDESGKFTKAETKAEPAKEPVKETTPADVPAILAERRRRQAVEQELAALRAQSQTKPTPPPSVFENEEAAINARVDERIRPLRERFFNQSIRAAQAAYKDDFAEAYKSFTEVAERDPRMIQALQDAEDPGEYIYMHGMFHKELAGVNGNLIEYRKQVVGDMEGKLTAKDTQISALQAEIDTLKKAQLELADIPRSLNNASSGAAPKAGSEDDDDIRSVVKFGKPKT